MTANSGTPAPIRIGPRTFVWGQRTYVMGILNVSPDSFSGDGVTDVEAALERARRLVAEGADILDVGGESTRPGAAEVPVEEELCRVLPVLRRLRAALDVPISVDTSKAAVAREVLRAGADMINDVWGFRRDPALAAVVAEFGVPAVVMHNQRGRPFHDVIGDITAGLRASFAAARAAGVPEERLIVDPGFGFGWTPEQNLEMLRRLGELRALGRPVLVGTSRKSTIGLVLDAPVTERLEGTAATVAIAIAHGADVVRVHDVAAMVRVARMSDAVVRGTWRAPAGS